MSDVWYRRLGDEPDPIVDDQYRPRARTRDEQNPLDVAGLTVDLQDRACPRCRELWLPWQRTCPRDGTTTIPASELSTLQPPPPELG